MEWIIPQFSRAEVNKAGSVLVSGNSSIDELFHAIEIISNWRAAHSFPLNTLKMGLRKRCDKVEANCIVAQRVKRLSSIRHKLERIPDMQLSRMQDIGGCRAVVSTVAKVEELVALHYESEMKHKRDRCDNYIENPKPSGYRGHHLVYKYHSDRNETYNGLKIEVQLRTTLQHTWATAVGKFIQQSLKSSIGEAEWLRFFAMMGTAHALREGTAPVPNTPTGQQFLRTALRDYVNRLDVVNRLHGYNQTLRAVEDGEVKEGYYYILHIDILKMQVNISGFKRNELVQASAAYAEIERKIATDGGDVVLVSVDTLSALRRAYPNYYLDTHSFVESVLEAIN